MENLNLVETFSEFKEFKNIDRNTLMRILEDVFRHLLTKKYGSSDAFDIIVNIDKGDLEIYRTRTIVNDEDLTDENTEVSLSVARKIEPDIQLEDEIFVEQIMLSDFERREILTIRQHLNAKILEFEKDNIYRKYEDKVGEVITGEVYQVWRKEILVLDEEGIELVLPKTGQIPADNYKKGDTIRAVVARAEMKNGTPIIELSRTAPEFLERLFEQEVPEIYDGLITIKNIVREPGERAKVAVESYDDRIDPVGACVGMKGSRIHGIVRELRQENIDVINYSTNLQLFIARALSPAKITSIKIVEEEKRAEVYLKSDQVSLAIGKGGHNIRLAARLTGYEIDVYRDSAPDNEDVDIQEFNDEIDQWIIDEFKKIGLDTAKSILDISIEELVARTDLEEETILEVIRILKEEFE
jgi:transcription termination/antitermination protein NusA